MASIQDLQVKATALVEQVAAGRTVVDSAVVLLQGQTQSLVDIKQQLADAIAANDPAAIQAVADTLDGAIQVSVESTQALADAVVANTPAA